MRTHDVTMEREDDLVYCQNCVFQLIDKDQNARDPMKEEIMSRVADKFYEEMKRPR